MHTESTNIPPEQTITWKSNSVIQFATTLRGMKYENENKQKISKIKNKIFKLNKGHTSLIYWFMDLYF